MQKTALQETEAPNETTIAAIVAAEAGKAMGPFDTASELTEALSGEAGDREEMDYHVQRLGHDISALLYGCEGMLLAADQYCECRERLELPDYMDWMANHSVKAHLYVRKQARGPFHRLRVRQIVKYLNNQLRELDALLTVDERSPEIAELLALVAE